LRISVNVLSPRKQYKNYITDHRKGVSDVYNTKFKPELIKEGKSQELLDEIQQLIDTHDDSKYSEEEFQPYCDRFYGLKKDDFDHAAFDRAWNFHQKRNPHHWQYWVLINDKDEPQLSPQEIPFKYIIEMLSDWQSAGAHYGNTAADWYGKQKDKMIFHPNTRKIVEEYLQYLK
jgi:hypothetical protein